MADETKMVEGNLYRLTREFWQLGSNGRLFPAGTVFTLYSSYVQHLDWFAMQILVEGKVYTVGAGLGSFCEEV